MSVCPLCESEIDVTQALQAVAKGDRINTSQILADAIKEIERLREVKPKSIPQRRRRRK